MLCVGVGAVAHDVDGVLGARVVLLEVAYGVVDAYGDVLGVVDIHGDHCGWYAAGVAVEREVELFAARVVDGEGEGCACGGRVDGCRGLRWQQRGDLGVVAACGVHGRGAGFEVVLAEQFGSGGESDGPCGDDSGAQAGEGRRTGADDDAVQILRGDAGLRAGGGDVHLEAFDVGA